MRRLLIEAAAYLRDLGDVLRRSWNAFFFTPADPTSLGVIRIIVGLLAFWSLLVLGLDLHDYFGSTGWARPDVIEAMKRPLAWSFWFLVPDGWLLLAWCVCLAVLALLTLGVYSRVTAVLGWIIVVSTIRRLPVALYGFDQILSALMFYLAVTGASGQAVSLDRFLLRWRQARRAAASKSTTSSLAHRVTPDSPGVPRATISANLALRLIQIHVVIIYGIAGVAKLQGPSWWNGTAIWKTMVTGEFVALDFTGLAAWPWAINLLTHACLGLELLYPVFIWIKIVRPLWLAGVIALHAGIAIVSPGLTEFGVAMIAANLAFVAGTWLRSRATGPVQPSLRVLYDGACPRCRASMALLSAADPDRLLEPVDLTAVDVSRIDPRLTHEKCMQSMHVISSTGVIAVGFDAMRTLAVRLPLFWPLGFLGFFPGVASLGRRGYNWLAAIRPRDATCNDDVCGLHSPAPRTVPRDRGHAPLNDATHQMRLRQ